MEFAGRTAVITGAARGQGRNHAIALAERGCDLILIDGCADILSCAYPLATQDDLYQTALDCREFDVRVEAQVCDVRDSDRLVDVLGTAPYAIGKPKIDFLVCNAGIGPVLGTQANKHRAFTDCLDVMVTGVYHSILSTVSWMGRNGSIVITGSTAARKGLCPTAISMNHGWAGYHAAKTACVGLMRYFATALAERNIRVNMVHPSGVNTLMTVNDASDIAGPQADAVRNRLPVDLLTCDQVTEVVLHLLASDATTGCEYLLDAGCTL